jgi:hypothetical protein
MRTCAKVRWANAWPAWPMTSAGEGVSDGGDGCASHALGEIDCDSFAPTPTRTCGIVWGDDGRAAGGCPTNSHSIPTSLTHAVLLVDFPCSHDTQLVLFNTPPPVGHAALRSPPEGGGISLIVWRGSLLTAAYIAGFPTRVSDFARGFQGELPPPPPCTTTAHFSFFITRAHANELTFEPDATRLCACSEGVTSTCSFRNANIVESLNVHK